MATGSPAPPAARALGRAARRGTRLRLLALVIAAGALAAIAAVTLARGERLDVVVAAVEIVLVLVLTAAFVVHVRSLVRERQRLALADLLLDLGAEPRRIGAVASAALSTLVASGLADAGVIALAVDGAPEARPIVASGYAPDWVDDAPLLPLREPPAAPVLRRADEPHPWVDPLRPTLGARPWFAAVPLLAGETSIGVLLLVARRPGPMRDPAVLAMASRPLAALLHQAELYEAAYARERELEDEAARHREFLASIAHEVRTPLTSIHAFADLLAAGGDDDAPREDDAGTGGPRAAAPSAQLLGSLTRGVERLTSLINDLLELGQADAHALRFDPRPVDVEDVLKLAESVLRPAFMLRDQTLELDQPERPVYVTADRRHLEQVVINLLSNANRHTPAGGRISARAVAVGQGVVRIEVDDSGPGVDAADRTRIFESYYRARRPGADAVPGSGLGLAVARRLVQLHGGRIWVEDAPGGGARFCVELRAAGADATAPRSRFAEAEPPPPRAADAAGERA